MPAHVSVGLEHSMLKRTVDSFGGGTTSRDQRPTRHGNPGTEENTMQLAKQVICAAGVMAMILGGASTAHGQTVTFSDIRDAVPGRFFDAATSAADAAEPNRLRIGFHTGINPETFTFNDFRASTGSFSVSAAMDTIGFRVTAPNGYYISKITYSQNGTGSVVGTGRAAGMTNWVAGEFVGDLGRFSINPAVSGTFEFTDLFLTTVPVSATTGLFAFSSPSLGSAEVSLTGADVLVEVLPCPRKACDAKPRGPKGQGPQ
jgi:hypothetical protein